MKLLKLICETLFKITGWKFSGIPVPAEKIIVISAFHTSNWDFLLCMGSQFISGRRVRWFGKHSLFYPPFGFIMRALGGIPVNRSHKQGLVASMTEAFDREERIILAIFPEGTRKKNGNWKTGFYQIATATGAPIQCMALDYATKTIKFGTPFHVSGNLEQDFQKLREFFATSTPKYPEKAERNFTYARAQ